MSEVPKIDSSAGLSLDFRHLPWVTQETPPAAEGGAALGAVAAEGLHGVERRRNPDRRRGKPFGTRALFDTRQKNERRKGFCLDQEA